MSATARNTSAHATTGLASTGSDVPVIAIGVGGAATILGALMLRRRIRPGE
ncbi:LPXTG cell wall anchor domain-containing protein [Microbacterium sp. ZW T5_45]|uniref:LPXTG cell wall anchor domain-containing protein n=1 Tax=Microbacterium sp. ZW T5_45 TaxID=3378080 RepID=UPI003851B314